MFMPVFHQVNYNLDTGQTQKDGIGYIISCNHFIHTYIYTYTPPFRFLLVSVWLGAINKQKTASPRKNSPIYRLLTGQSIIQSPEDNSSQRYNESLPHFSHVTE